MFKKGTLLITNSNLESSVIAGCLRITRESIFTGLNHLRLFSVLNAGYAEHFGFTQPEVEQLLREYGLEDKAEEALRQIDIALEYSFLKGRRP